MQEQARNKYRELSKEEKNKKREYGRNRYHKMSKKNKKTNRLLKKRKKMNIKNVCLFSLSGIKNEKINLGFWWKMYY